MFSSIFIVEKFSSVFNTDQEWKMPRRTPGHLMSTLLRSNLIIYLLSQTISNTPHTLPLPTCPQGWSAAPPSWCSNAGRSGPGRRWKHDPGVNPRTSSGLRCGARTAWNQLFLLFQSLPTVGWSSASRSVHQICRANWKGARLRQSLHKCPAHCCPRTRSGKAVRWLHDGWLRIAGG